MGGTVDRKLIMHQDRLFPTQQETRSIARRLYDEVRDLPIISPHGHTDPRWYAENINFDNPAQLFITPDHYLFRMLYSQGLPLERLGLTPRGKQTAQADPKDAWQCFAEQYHLFRGTPSRIWFDHALHEVFGVDQRLGPDTAPAIYDRINAQLGKPEFRVRSLYERFNIEAIATTDSPLDDLAHHRALARDSWPGRVLPAFRPDPVVDPEFEGFAQGVEALGRITGEDTTTWSGYLKALAQRRQDFKALGCTSTDHGHPSAATADLDPSDCQLLLDKALKGTADVRDAELFRAQMLTEMVGMSLDDGLVVQLHPGPYRNHNKSLYERFGRDMGADIPQRTEFVKALKPLLDKFGNEACLTLVLFTLDESSYSRELAPLAGHYPLLKLGPAWWFQDSPEGMLRYRRLVMETAGFYNTVGFNDDTRSFLSIPARHDMSRRIDCGFLAGLVAEHRLEEDEALELAQDLAYNLAKAGYNI